MMEEITPLNTDKDIMAIAQFILDQGVFDSTGLIAESLTGHRWIDEIPSALKYLETNLKGVPK